MTDSSRAQPEARLLFTEHEWRAAMPQLTKDMTAFLAEFRTPIFKNQGTHGEGWGSGSFVEIDGTQYILTNQHVATVRHDGERLGTKLKDLDDLANIVGNHVERAWPWDLALLPVSKAVWEESAHTSTAIKVEQFSLAYSPVETEVFAFSGFAGERTHFHFSSLLLEATTSLAREVILPADENWDSRFHFGLDYRPDLATNVIGSQGLPNPPGLSGSTVWNTCFVEAKFNDIQWTPDLARVAGVVWGWSSTHGLIVATRVEHVRSFLLGGHLQLKANTSALSRP